MRHMSLADMGDLKLLRLDQVLELVPISKPTVYRGIKDRSFPEQRHYKGMAMWRECDIRSWIETNFPPSQPSRDNDDLI